jgi:tetratricopeptide (TPR) repeat protein
VVGKSPPAPWRALAKCKEGNEEALRLFYQAIERDPNYAAAYAVAAMGFSNGKAFGWVTVQELAEARSLALRAVQLGKDDATLLSCAGYVLAYVAGELDDGAAFLDRALLINPNSALGWVHGGWVKVWLGEPDSAIEHFCACYAPELYRSGPLLYTTRHRACSFLCEPV